MAITRVTNVVPLHLFWRPAGNKKVLESAVSLREVMLLQMGGPAGVMASEHVLLTVSPSKGMKMHATPRRLQHTIR